MKKAGILGGGQLGRMLLQAGINYPVETFVLESDLDCPAAHLCHHFIQGDITSYDDVYQFGKLVDVLTIEIENVNIAALEQLEKEGVEVYPRPAALSIIKDKIRQKQFYQQHSIPSPAFVVTEDRAALQLQEAFLPAVHKLAQGGYDGRGVQVIASAADMEQGFDVPAVLEKRVDIHKEIAMMAAVSHTGETALYPAVDMVFNPYLNQLDYQLCPAELPENQLWRLEAIALKVVKELQSPGIFAVELFIDKAGEIYVNETAPRVHNSGHHTIEACYSSQFDMLWRILLHYPLGNTDCILPAAIVNLVGEAGHSGPAVYEGLHEILQIEDCFVHLYGKSATRPGRKMGHVTVLSKEKQELLHQARRIKQTLKVIAQQAVS